MTDVRELPHMTARVETGPTQFGNDWPGVFIRGDDAIGMAISLRFMDSSPIYAAALLRLIRLLESCNVTASAGEAGTATTTEIGVAEGEHATGEAGDAPTPPLPSQAQPSVGFREGEE